ncbi:MAG: polysaccharide deacetylase family protein [Inquilinus sp.]|uniref:polysaccharide deacetylase family protein n=1 Tax=Inquilinus sp. TaxID=1932117 RepID=UPI003F32D3CE
MRTALVLALALGFGASSATARPWPNGAKAAVVLTYDDALTSQLDNAVPALDRRGFKGTFFLSNVKQVDVPRWRTIANEGHELANHTLFHPCSAKTVSWDPRYTLEAYTPDSMLKEIGQQNVLLTAIDGKFRHGFAPPCGETLAGGKDYLEPLRAANLVSYSRGVFTKPADLSADVSAIDLMHIPARAFPEGVTGAQLIDFAEQAQAGGGMAVFAFHGVDGDYSKVSGEAHEALLDWLYAHRQEIWVTTLQDALDWAKDLP